MAVKAKAEITISRIIDIDKVTRYYLLQSSTATAPSKPTANPPGGNWKTTEPSYTSGSTNTLYFVDLTVMTNGSFSYSAVSKSSSYEAAKEAWNKANNAQNTADNVNGKIDDLQIGGRNLLLYSANLKNGYYTNIYDTADETFKGCSVFKVKYAWHGIKPYFNKHITERNVIKAGDVLTYSVYAKTDDTKEIDIVMINRTMDNNNGQGTIRGNQGRLKLSNDWKLYSITFKVTESMLSVDKGISCFGYELGESTSSGKYVYFACPKLENSNKPTDYTPAPEDTEEKIETASKDAAKTATNYLKGSEDGLVVGNMTSEILGSNVLINPDSVNIRDGDTILARYSKKKIELGLKSNDSIIELCGGIGTISSDFINNDIPYLFICSENIYIGKSILDEGANREVNIDTNMKESYSEVSMSSRYIGNSAYIGVNASKDAGSMFKLSVDGNDKQTQVYIRHGFNATDDYSAYEGVDIWTQDVVRFTNNKSLNHIGIGIGSGGINRGIHDTDYNHWMLYCDEKDLYYQAPETSKIRPYYRAGDSIQLYYQGVGFATSDGKYVVFTLPINKPIDASNVVASSVSGFIGRSNGKYTHGSTSSTYVKPASYEAVINGNAVRVSMKFNNNTNVTNNAAIGVTWSGKITFS